MSRATIAVDRFVTLVLGIFLVAGGVLVVAWYYEWWDWFPAATDLSEALRVTTTRWWPWALAGAALLLLLLGLRWLLAHTPGRRVSTLRLPGSGSEGRLQVDASGAVSGACGELRARHDVRSAQGVVRREQGELLVEIRAVLEQHSDLREVAAAVDAATGRLTECIERPDLLCRVRLDVVGRATKPSARVA